MNGKGKGQKFLWQIKINGYITNIWKVSILFIYFRLDRTVLIFISI